MGDKAVKAPGRGARTRKYLDRQEAILRVAVQMLNRGGLRSMTLADVAEHFGLVSTGVAYYFRTKELLAAACFRRSIETHERLIAEAFAGVTIEDRVRRLVGGYFHLLALIAQGESDDIALFEDIRSLNDTGLEQAYVEMFRHLRALLEAAGGDRATANARTHYLLQQLVWARYWLARYDPEDYPRAAERMADILLNGLDAGAQAWSPLPLPLGERGAGETDAREVFLRAATQLINEQGYRGASVERIAARLEVTKGSFYYRIDAKDDLIEVCYLRTVEVMRHAQQAAGGLPCAGRERLTAAIAHLIDHQLDGEAPLLRFPTASVPDTIRQNIQAGCDRIGLRFGSMLSDGVADGSLRPVDIQIAAQMLISLAIAGAELGNWLPAPPDARTTEAFARPLFAGLSRPQSTK